MLHCIFRSPKGAGLVPGVTRFSRGHAEFSAGSEAYGDGFACLLPVASRLVGMLQSWYQSIGSKVKSQLHSLESVTAMVGIRLSENVFSFVWTT